VRFFPVKAKKEGRFGNGRKRKKVPHRCDQRKMCLRRAKGGQKVAKKGEKEREIGWPREDVAFYDFSTRAGGGRSRVKKKREKERPPFFDANAEEEKPILPLGLFPLATAREAPEEGGGAISAPK